jgi:hypothetical protein
MSRAPDAARCVRGFNGGADVFLGGGWVEGCVWCRWSDGEDIVVQDDDLEDAVEENNAIVVTICYGFVSKKSNICKSYEIKNIKSMRYIIQPIVHGKTG